MHRKIRVKEFTLVSILAIGLFLVDNLASVYISKPLGFDFIVRAEVLAQIEVHSPGIIFRVAGVFNLEGELLLHPGLAKTASVEISAQVFYNGGKSLLVFQRGADR